MGATTRLLGSIHLLLAVGVLAGCSANETPPAPPPSSAVATPAPVTTTSRAAPPAAPPRAADGTDYAACRDGRCQVEVRTGTAITLGGRLGLRTLTILGVSGDGVSFGGDAGNGNTVSSSSPVGSTNTLQELSVTVDAVSGDTAVITLAPA